MNTKFLRPWLGLMTIGLALPTNKLVANTSTQEKFSVVLNGQTHDFTMDESLSISPSHELMALITFSNGATGLITSTVVVDGDDLLKNIDPAYSQRLVKIPFTSSYKILLSSPREAIQLSRSLNTKKGIHFAHPDFVFSVEPRGRADQEPLFESQWSLKNTGQNGGTANVDIGIESAWAVTHGTPETIVAVLDLGFEQNHKDLVDAWLINSKEIPGNKIDDDGNGLIDDVRGWNFSTNAANLIYGAAPNHGTATSGLIGARSNGIGISGICPGCKILPVVVSGRVSEDASAIGYAVSRGASVFSNSWGYQLATPQTDVVSQALTTAARTGRSGRGIPIIFAMRNSETDDCRPTAPDISAHPDVIAVSSIDFHDVKVPSSGYGDCLAFLAPSSGTKTNGIPVTDRSGASGYNTDGVGNFSDLDFHNGFFGTSAAAPHAAGLFALLLSAEPNLTRDQAFGRMKDSAVKANPTVAKYDPVTKRSLRYGFGRINAATLFQQKSK